MRRLRAALLAGTCLGASPALAVDGIWTGPGTEWTTGTNWSSSPTAPDNTATFTGNGAPTSLTVSISTSINTIQFNSAAPVYTITRHRLVSFPIVDTLLNINGSGIVNNSANAPHIVVSGGFTTLNFNNSSTAGNATIDNQFSLLSQTVAFNGSSTAGNATISSGGVLRFNDNSTAGNATITNSRALRFSGASTAGNAIIDNTFSMTFAGTSTAGNAVINSNGPLGFQDASSAGNATIAQTGPFGLSFAGNSTPGNARLINNGGTIFSI